MPTNELSSSMKRPLAFLILHGVIIGHFLIEIAYTAYQTMVVLRPAGAGIAPLGALALHMDPTMFMMRRGYAIENWIATSGLVIYLAVTEIAPRFWPRQR